MSHRTFLTHLVFAAITLIAAGRAEAQRPSTTTPSRGFEIGGYATIGRIDFTAAESFDAVMGEHAGRIFGGGARIGLPWYGLFVDLGAWRFRGTGERVFVHDGTPFPLGIDTTVTVTPIEISGGWRLRLRRAPRFTPYVAAGVTSMRYQETSDFAIAGEDVDDNFTGYHVFGGAEYKLTSWLGIAGEAAWTTVPDGLGAGGVSAAFGETDLGGTSMRFKITVGR